MIDTFFNTFNNHLQVSIIASSTIASLSCKSLVTFQDRETGLLRCLPASPSEKRIALGGGSPSLAVQSIKALEAVLDSLPVEI
jgi:hypothetical protein